MISKYILVNFQINPTICVNFFTFVHELLDSPLYNVLSQVYLSNQKEESISIQKVMMLYKNTSHNLIKHFNFRFHDDVRETQPDGGDNERCSVLRLYSIRSTQNWHDVACSYDKIYNYICETDANTSLNGKKILFV